MAALSTTKYAMVFLDGKSKWGNGDGYDEMLSSNLYFFRFKGNIKYTYNNREFVRIQSEYEKRICTWVPGDDLDELPWSRVSASMSKLLSESKHASAHGHPTCELS
eukprot:3560262-Karenia_brevis.AAC.1